VGFFCAVILIKVMCELCILEDRTNTYMDTKKFIILDCDSCYVPMAVWKEHTMSIRKEYEELMESMLHKVAKEFYKDKPYFIDKKQNAIHDHLHWHVRPLNSKGHEEKYG